MSSSPSSRNVHFDTNNAKGNRNEENHKNNKNNNSSSSNNNDSQKEGGGSRGPFRLNKEDVYAAFEFFDAGGSGTLTPAQLKTRLSAFYPDMGTKEYKFLFEDMRNINVAAAGEPHATSASASITAAQLWELIDTFQRLYLIPAQQAQGEPAPTTAPTVSPKLLYHTVADYDPVKETFNAVYDPQHTGEVSVQQTLRPLMAKIGFGELHDDELALLVRTADFNRDGKITLDDFRELVSMKGRFRK